MRTRIFVMHLVDDLVPLTVVQETVEPVEPEILEDEADDAQTHDRPAAQKTRKGVCQKLLDSNIRGQE